jgi:hypothetical protein
MSDQITKLLPFAVASLAYVAYHIYQTRNLKGTERRDALVPPLLIAGVGFGAVMALSLGNWSAMQFGGTTK